MSSMKNLGSMCSYSLFPACTVGQLSLPSKHSPHLRENPQAPCAPHTPLLVGKNISAFLKDQLPSPAVFPPLQSVPLLATPARNPTTAAPCPCRGFAHP